MKASSVALLAWTLEALAQNVVEFQLNRGLPSLHIGSPPAGLDRRAYYTESVANNLTGGGYYTKVKVGGQEVSMIVDTGSSDAWVLSYKADICTSARLQAYYGDSCSATYNPSKSSNYKLVQSKAFSITYLDGGGAEGDYISDDFTIGGATVKSLQLGYATSASRGTGILGVGFAANEAASKKYPNLIDSLVEQGLITTKAYSLYLNDRRSPTGNILLGGVDTDKFIGPLSVLPILKTSSSADYTTLMVAFNGMSVKYANGSSTDVASSQKDLPGILDSGTTLSYIPDTMAKSLYRALGAYTDTRNTGLTFVDCKYLHTQSASFMLEFTFGSNVKLLVPVEEMVLDVVNPASSLPNDMPFNNPCLFGIQSTGGFQSKRAEHYSRQLTANGFALLGDTFLRSAYVVYDLSNAQIALAPANLNSSDAKVTELTGAATQLAAFTGVASQQTTATVASTGTGSSPTGTGAQVTVTVTTGAKNSGTMVKASSSEIVCLVAITSLFTFLGGAIFAL